MHEKKTPQKPKAPSAEDMVVTVEPTLKGMSATGFVGGKTNVENPITKRWDGLEFGFHFSQTWEGTSVTEEFITERVVAGTINGIRKVQHEYRARIEKERADAKALAEAKEAAAKLAAREEAESQNVTTTSNA